MKALYERVIIEEIKDETKEVSVLDGLDDGVVTTKVKVIDWGTNVEGKPFPMEPGAIATVSGKPRVTPLDNGQFIMDRRLILAFEYQTENNV